MRLVRNSSAPAAVTRSNPRPRVVLGAVVGVVTAVLLTIVLSVDLLPRVYQVREGDVAPAAIKAQNNVTYVSQIRTREARDAAAAQVPPVIELDRDLIVQQTRALADLIQAVNMVRGDRARTVPAD